MMRGEYIIGLIILFAVSTVAKLFTESQERNIENLVDKVMECRNIPGMVLSVVKGPESWSRGYGLADMETERSVDNTTVFAIGSLGKAMTMALLGRILQQNGYNWETKLSDLIDGDIYEFPQDFPSGEVTIADLLTHRTGLSSILDYGFIAGYPEGTTREEMSRKIKMVPTIENFREQFVYNNFMYMVLGHVTETLGNDTWENLVTSDLLERIGMNDSTVLKFSNDVLSNNSAKPYVLRDGLMQPGTAEIYKISPLEPAGSIMSTGEDMVKWVRFNMNNATTDSGENIVEPELISQAYQEQFMFSTDYSNRYSYKTPTYPINDITSGYGYAWFTATYRGYRKLWHSGGLFSYVSVLWLFPNEQIGIFGSVNGPALPSTSGRGLITLFWYISDLLLGFEPWIDIDTICTFPAPWRNLTKRTDPPFENYTNDKIQDFVGTYVSQLLPDVRISRDNGSADNERLVFEMNRIKGHLYPRENESFKLDFQMTEPWEYAIERVVNENFTIRYLTEFVETTGNEVGGFNITLQANVAISFQNQSWSDDDSTGRASFYSGAWTLSILCVTKIVILKP